MQKNKRTNFEKKEKRFECSDKKNNEHRKFAKKRDLYINAKDAIMMMVPL